MNLTTAAGLGPSPLGSASLFDGQFVLVAGLGIALAALGVWVLAGLGRRVVLAVAGALSRRARSASGAPLFYLVAAMSTAVSANTSWRFFGEQLRITDIPERAAMFAVLEVALIACAYAMRAAVRNGGGPGGAQSVAWTLTGLSAYMAIAESDFWEGIARVALGPVLGLVALHLALGVELRRAHAASSTPWAQLLGEVRERLLSRVGLANDDRDAATRTRHRAALRAARLAAEDKAKFRDRRLARAVRTAGVAHDVQVRALMLAELSALRGLSELTKIAPPSPWSSYSRTAANGGRADSADGGRPAVRPSTAANPVQPDVQRGAPVQVGQLGPDGVTGQDVEPSDGKHARPPDTLQTLAERRAWQLADFREWVVTLDVRPKENAVRNRYGCRQKVAQRLLASLDKPADEPGDESDREVG